MKDHHKSYGLDFMEILMNIELQTLHLNEQVLMDCCFLTEHCMNAFLHKVDHV